MIWSIVKAKEKFSEVVQKSTSSPQVISRNGTPIAVVLDIEEYQRLKKIVGPAHEGTPMSRFLKASERLRSELEEEDEPLVLPSRKSSSRRAVNFED